MAIILFWECTFFAMQGFETAILDAAPMAIAVLDKHGQILYCNPQCVALSGSPDKFSLQGHSLNEIGSVEQVTLRRVFSQALAAGIAVEGEMPFRTSWKRHMVLHYRVVPLTPQPDHSAALVLYASDVTEQRESEQAMLRAKEEADRANKAKSEFLATISHEIRTPMNGVLGFLSLLSSRPLDAESMEYVEIAQSSGDSLLRLINEILDLSRIDAGKMTLEPRPFDAAQVAHEVCKVAANALPKPALKVVCEISREITSPLVADSGRFRQVLLNLVNNAIKFTDSGQVCVRLRPLVPSDALPNMLLVEVHDTGIGISDQGLQNLFHPFSQVDSSSTRRYEGSGLGLAISKKLVQMMGGEIGVESQPGKGSRFWFTLPWHSPSDCVPSWKRPTGALRVVSPLGPHSPPSAYLRRRILVVDDNPSHRKLTQLFLQEGGWQSDEASGSQHALELHSTNPYDLIVLDCMMPGMDGFEFSRTIRNKGWQGPIVALTALTMAGDHGKCLASGMDEVLTKPCAPEQLLARVHHWLGQ